jgi:serine/threonine protein kinase
MASRDSYQTVKMLGKGSFGTVSLALHVPTLRLYAVSLRLLESLKCAIPVFTYSFVVIDKEYKMWLLGII